MSARLETVSRSSYTGWTSGSWGTAGGIAGSLEPKADGIFLYADEWTLDFFVRMNNTGGAVDVWAADSIDADAMVEPPNGYQYLPGIVHASDLTLVQTDLLPEISSVGESRGYASRLTIEFDEDTTQ